MSHEIRTPLNAVIGMTGLLGLGATRRIRALHPRGGRPWIIGLTANALEGDRAACLEAGMDDYVAKPVQLEDLDAAFDACRHSSPRSRNCPQRPCSS